MPQASRTIVVNVAPSELMNVIADYEQYPQFLPEVKKITVAGRTATSAEVTYEIEVIKRIRYTLRIETEPLGSHWTLVKGDLFKKNEGSWRLEATGDGATRATYTLEIAIGGLIPVPKAITDRLTEHSLPALLENFKKRAEALYPRAATA